MEVLVTAPYRPANGIEGAWFADQFCDRCAQDADYYPDGDGCPIIPNAMVLKPDDADYPPEWVCDDNGDNPRCTAFEEEER